MLEPNQRHWRRSRQIIWRQPAPAATEQVRQGWLSRQEGEWRTAVAAKLLRVVLWTVQEGVALIVVSAFFVILLWAYEAVFGGG